MEKDIILASGSPRRKALLEKLGLKFKVIESKYEEDMTLKFIPKKLVQVLAMGKASDVAEKCQNSRLRGNDRQRIIIAADTIVVLGKEILGKPHTPKNAIKMLQKLSGQTHTVYTGLVVLVGHKQFATTVSTKVKFRKLSQKEVFDYVASKEPLDKAGAYAMQENAGVFVEKIIGDYNNIVGLPVSVLVKILQKVGVKI